MAYVHEIPQSALSSGQLGFTLGPMLSRTLLVGVAMASIATSVFFIGPDAPARAGVDLTNLLRFMAALKAVLALAAFGAVFWRLTTSIAPASFGVYAIATAAMSGGPGLIWGMDHVGLGALLLHAGLAAAIVLLWRDPATASLLKTAVSRKQRDQRQHGQARKRVQGRPTPARMSPRTDATA